jgi:DNA-binding winged helix-turn-helix (wHTH) protein/tetratricopeptide (TPR) repeat protein
MTSTDSSGLQREEIRHAESPAATDVRFDGWVLRRGTGELFRNDTRVRLQEQPLRILDELLATPGEVVTRQRLIHRLWPKGIVEFDTSLNTAVRKLRAALGDDPERPRYIETVPRKGYRFVGRIHAPVGPSAPRSTPPRAPGHTEAVPARPRFRSTRWAIAAVLLVGVVAGAWLAPPAAESGRAARIGLDRVPLTTNAEAFDLYLRAEERISQIMPNQPELPRGDSIAPREQVLSWLDQVLRLDPSFALGHVLRARVHLDHFIANLDVSEERLVAVRADLERARQLANDESIGDDVRGLYAAFVDVDPERGLRVLGYGEASADSAALLNQARILTSMGRVSESDDLLRQLLVSEPVNQLLFRMRASNVISQNDPQELFRLVAQLRGIGSPEADYRGWTYLFTGEAGGPALDVDAMSAAAAEEAAGEQLFALSNDLMFLRHQHRYADVKRILSATRAESLRFGSFIGASPGLGQRPVAELRGWNELLLGNAAAAAEHGREVLAFVAKQRETKSNAWVLHMLRAEGHVFVGDHAAAVDAVRESLRVAPLLAQVEAHRRYLAAMTLAWVGEHEEAVVLLEQATTVDLLGAGPARIAREPLLTVPLQANARFQQLVEQLAKELDENRTLQHTRD